MRILLYFIIALFMSANFTSCTPTNLVEAEKAPIAKEECCDEEGDILPPPPPPPPTGDGD